MRRKALLGAAFCLWAAPLGAAQAPSEFQKGAVLFNMKCAKCHTVGGGDRVGPDLRGATDRHERDWILNFIMRPEAYLDTDPDAKRLREKYNGVRMENTRLTRAEAEGILEYLKAASAGPQAPEEAPALEEEPFSQRLKMPDEELSVSRPGVVLLFVLLAGAAALWQFSARLPSVLLMILASAAAYWSFGGRRYYHLLGNQQGYEPPQPIAFSHALHAGRLGISCLYCHYGAERSDVAGVPAVSVCMNCHGAVRKSQGAKEPSAEIAKLVSLWEARGKAAPASIGWTRVHQLPDYVHFSHRAHVDSNIQCQECHGPVQRMERVRQAASLSMGWCVQCHRLKAGAAPTHWQRSGGPLDCAACHW